MSSLKKFKDLVDARKQKQEMKEKLLRKFKTPRPKPKSKQTRSSKSKSDINLKNTPKDKKEIVQKNIAPVINKCHPWGKLHSGDSSLKFFRRTQSKEELQLQPWASELVDLTLETTEKGEINLCLIWPVRLFGLALLHALANIERNFAKDLRGMRTLLYPGKRTYRISLQSTLVNREQLSDLFRSLWVHNEEEGLKFECHTQSKSFKAMLTALNDIRENNPEMDDPSLAELIPAFTYVPEQQDWTTVANFPLERSLKKVDKLARRRILREKVNDEWGNPIYAPGAMMVLPQNTNKSNWEDSLGSEALKENNQPEIILLDATSLSNYKSIMKIPDFLNVAIENGYENCGALIVTDDPKTFFVLRDKLVKLKLKYKEKIWAAESDRVNAILSPQALSADWKPEQKSLANFKVDIVDRDASQVALSFQRLAKEAGNYESSSYEAVINACCYIARLSNLPAGYSDLTAKLTKTKEGHLFVNQKNSWSSVRIGLQEVLESGQLNAKRKEADEAISKAEKLIDMWADATPLASKLFSEVKKYVIEDRKKLLIVLPNIDYIELAQNFLKRKLANDWETVKLNIDWHTLLTVRKVLSEKFEACHFLFIGVNSDVIRCLIAHPDIPHGTSVLITYKQAKSTLITLKSMNGIEVFRPYRGRMGLLIQQLTLKLNEIPNPLNIEKLHKMNMQFNLEAVNNSNDKVNQTYFKFGLEDGSHHYATGMLYRYEADEDPFFRRVNARSIEEGDFIFVMDDELRTKLESVLQLTNDGSPSEVYPQRVLLKIYHEDIKYRCEIIFKEQKRSTLAKVIHKKMIDIDTTANNCRSDRINYWLDLKIDGDTKPHAPKDFKFFKIFCMALEINDEQAVMYWNYIRNARSLNIELGRQLSAQYAEILFQPESAFIYRKISKKVIRQLQQEALRCVYCVENITLPQNKRNDISH